MVIRPKPTTNTVARMVPCPSRSAQLAVKFAHIRQDVYTGTRIGLSATNLQSRSENRLSLAQSVDISCDIIRRSMLRPKIDDFRTCFEGLRQIELLAEVGDNLVREWRGAGLPLSAEMGCAAAFASPCYPPKFMVTKFQWLTLYLYIFSHKGGDVTGHFAALHFAQSLSTISLC